MNKKTIRYLIILLLCAIPVWCLIIAKVLWYPHFTIPTTGMEPSMKQDSWVLGKRTGKTERGDAVFYRYYHPFYGSNIYIHRIIGLPGDLLEIRNGIVYINDTIGDKYWCYKYRYKVVGINPRDLIKKDIVYPDEVWYDSDTAYILLDPQEITSLLKDPHVVFFSPGFEPKGAMNEVIQSKYGKNWNADNFGPYRVPAGYCFLMGDNRHNSIDSRHVGPVPAEDIQGVMLE